MGGISYWTLPPAVPHLVPLWYSSRVISQGPPFLCVSLSLTPGTPHGVEQWQRRLPAAAPSWPNPQTLFLLLSHYLKLPFFASSTMPLVSLRSYPLDVPMSRSSCVVDVLTKPACLYRVDGNGPACISALSSQIRVLSSFAFVGSLLPSAVSLCRHCLTP